MRSADARVQAIIAANQTTPRAAGRERRRVPSTVPGSAHLPGAALGAALTWRRPAPARRASDVRREC